MKKTALLFSLILSLFYIDMHAQDQYINGRLAVKSEISVGVEMVNTWGMGTWLKFNGVDTSSDPVWMAKYTNKLDITDLRVNVGDNPDSEDRFVVGTTEWKTNKYHEYFVVRMDGNVGVGVSYPTSKLEVNGTIRAKEVKIEATGWPDFVFSKDYQLPSLSEVEAHIIEKKHLPNIPSEAEVKESGVDVGEMQVKLLQKIEELTLYAIEQQKQINSLAEQLKNK